MCKKSIYATAYCLLTLFIVDLSHAEDALYQDDVRNILVGNTIEGKIIERDASYKMYLHPSGKLIRVDSKDALEKGKWQITNNNELCLNIVSEKCLTIKKRGEGKFDLYSTNDKLELTIDQVILGNPDKMKP